MPGEDLQRIINETYAVFLHDEVAPVLRLQDAEYVMELFHGPTLAFKDFALQLLGRLLDYFLERRKKHVAILGLLLAIPDRPRWRDVDTASTWTCTSCIRITAYQKCSAAR